MAVNRKLYDEIKKVIVKGIQRNGDRIFSISQDTAGCYVPVDTGFLKASGNTEPLQNGVEIIYRADYSAKVEFGSDEREIEGTQRVYVKSHTIKKGKRKGARVKGHYKEYKDKKLITWKPKLGEIRLFKGGSKFEREDEISRVISKESKREGQFFLSRAALKGIQELPNDIEFYLRELNNRPIK